MRRWFCLICGKAMETSADGPFKCPVCLAKEDKNQPKFGGVRTG